MPPDEVNSRHNEQTPAGSSYHRGDPEMGDLPHRVQPDPDGRYTVDVHVTPEGNARIGGRDYTPEEFADILRRNGDYDGRPIRLIGCDAGSNDFAHRLSHELDTDVLAPNKPAWTDSNGHVFSSDYEIGPDGRVQPKIPPNGEWSTHHPDGTTSHASDDGFTPDTHDVDKHDLDPSDARARGDGNPDVDQDGTAPSDRYADTDWGEEWGDYEVPAPHRPPIVDYDRTTHQPPHTALPTIQADIPRQSLFPPRTGDLPDNYRIPRVLRDHPELFDADGNLPANRAIPVEYRVENGSVGARTTFYTDANGDIKWVELSPGMRKDVDGIRAGTNPDFNQVLPNCKYEVENWRNTDKKFHFETNEYGRSEKMSGQPDYGPSDDNYRDLSAQDRANKEGKDAREGGDGTPYKQHPDHKKVAWAGGHLAPTEAGAPGGYGNMHGQMAASNSGNNKDGWSRPETWREQEEQIAAYAKQDHQNVELLEVEVPRRAGDHMAPEEVMRWRVKDTDPVTGEERVRVFERRFTNVPENMGIDDWSGVPRYGNRS